VPEPTGSTPAFGPGDDGERADAAYVDDLLRGVARDVAPLVPPPPHGLILDRVRRRRVRRCVVGAAVAAVFVVGGVVGVQGLRGDPADGTGGPAAVSGMPAPVTADTSVSRPPAASTDDRLLAASDLPTAGGYANWRVVEGDSILPGCLRDAVGVVAAAQVSERSYAHDHGVGREVLIRTDSPRAVGPALDAVTDAIVACPRPAGAAEPLTVRHDGETRLWLLYLPQEYEGRSRVTVEVGLVARGDTVALVALARLSDREEPATGLLAEILALAATRIAGT